MRPTKPRPEDASAYELVAFDLRVPGSMGRLISEGTAWRSHAHVELLDPCHAVLVIRACGAYGAKRRAA